MKLNAAVRSFMPALLLTLSASGLAQFARAQQTDTAIRVLENELGGVVTGPNGPEAGVWVIAETTELPTKFARSSSPTSGALSHSRSSEGELQRLGAWLWSRRFAEDECRRRAALAQSHGRAAPSEKEAAQYYPAMYWCVARQVAGQKRVPAAEDQEPGRVAQHHQDRCLRFVPRARHAGHADDLARSWAVPDLDRSLGRGA